MPFHIFGMSQYDTSPTLSVLETDVSMLGVDENGGAWATVSGGAGVGEDADERSERNQSERRKSPSAQRRHPAQVVYGDPAFELDPLAVAVRSSLVDVRSQIHELARTRGQRLAKRALDVCGSLFALV